MVEQYVYKGRILSYAHRPVNSKKFIFPITGLKLGENDRLKVGKINFVGYKYLLENVISDDLYSNDKFKSSFSNVKTYAIVDLELFGDYKELCEHGNNSLALQILKQTIGILYISIYNEYKKSDRYDLERRIIISDNGVNEVDEGLSSYISIDKNKQSIIYSSVNKDLEASVYDFDLNNVKDILNIMEKKLTDRTQFENKICKSLEIIYSIFNENSSRERVFKWPIILNYLFREDTGDINIQFIVKKLKAIFTIIMPQQILESIPDYIAKDCKNTDKVNKIVEDIYTSIRNKIMHGHINLYEEYTSCKIENITILKVVTLELINTLCQSDFVKCNTTKELNKYISDKEKEYSKKKRESN